MKPYEITVNSDLISSVRVEQQELSQCRDIR